MGAIVADSVAGKRLLAWFGILSVLLGLIPILGCGPCASVIGDRIVKV